MLWFRIEGHAIPAMTSAKKKQQNHENVPFSQGKTMWKAQQEKEKSGAARKREAYITCNLSGKSKMTADIK